MIHEADDDKYVVFKRAEFIELLDYQRDELLSANMKADAEKIAIKDAVVIRRQDYYASPALATYAASIAIAIKTTNDPEMAANLQAIADYFNRQSELAAEEGWHLPDL